MEMVTFEREDDENTTTTDNSYTELSDSDGEGKKVPPKTLLTLLDDKNRSICLLKRQVHNQKVQLSFYLHRVFNSPKIIELSEGCVPYETEENIQINLAMNQFCKQAGLKSRIMVLHARMIDIEKRIIRTLEQQEDMVHIIVTKIIEFKTNSTNAANSVQLCLSQLKKDCGQVELLAKVLGATNKLRKELDTFRTCCNRLLVIEDERNGLVEQVYSMPISQRMSYGVLLATQYEKIRLEKEVQEIKQDQKVLQDRFASLTREYSNSNIHVPRSNISDDQANISQMLETVNSEAISLLESTREQKDKYMDEIAKLKEINAELSQQLTSMQEIVKEKEELEDRMQKAAKEFQKLREYDQKHLNEYNIKLASITEEKNVLEIKLQHYNNIDEQMKCLRTQVEDMEMLRGQRDYYKLQVDDLQAIRAAYAQLVEHCPARGDEGDNKEQTGRIQTLEKKNHKMSTEIENLRELVCDQEIQIKHLLVIIEKLASHRDVTTPKVKRTLYSVQTTKNINSKDSGYSSESRSVYSQTDTSMMMKMMMKELHSPSSDNDYGIKNNFGTQTETVSDVLAVQERHFNISESISTQEPSRESENRCKSPITGSLPSLGKGSFTATTSVEVQSVNSEGKSESLKAILESSTPMDGVIEVNNSSSLSLRVTCTSSGKQNKCASLTNNEEKLNNKPSQLRIDTPNIDEFELMKDASSETLAVRVPSVRQKVVAMECVEYTSCNDRYASEDSFSRMLKRNAEAAEVAISRETIPEGNMSDVDSENEDEEFNADEEINEIDYESINEIPEIQGRKFYKISELTGRLQLITSNLDRTLAQPGGKDSLLSSMKLMYNTFLKDS